MKCPDCKFNSFDYLAVCPGCGADLSAYRQLYKLVSPFPMPLPADIVAAICGGDTTAGCPESELPEAIVIGPACPEVIAAKAIKAPLPAADVMMELEFDD